MIAAGRPSPTLIILVAAGAIPPLSYALGQAELQRIDTSGEHAEFNHWVETAFYSVGILLLGLITAWRPRLYRMAGWCSAAALIVLGGASLFLDDYESSLDTSWGWVALVGGVLFLLTAGLEARRLTP
jgi:hypothetical protein